MALSSIHVMQAQKEFGSDVRAGELVAFWISYDNTSSMRAVTKSWPTEIECLNEAEQVFAQMELRCGHVEISLVVED